mgnify:CR=1 FL=1
MDLLSVMTEYKAVLSGVFIGCATITGVALNIIYNKTLERKFKKNKNASTTSAIAAEILYNSYHLRDLYLEIRRCKSTKDHISEYKHIDTQVYQELLTQVGELGSAITFTVVDTYGDLKKMKGRMEEFSHDQSILKNKEIILINIQKALVKTLANSLMLYVYADYMSGRNWMKHIKEQRITRIERTLEGFCQFLEEIDNKLEFISTNEQEGLEFRKRFVDKVDRQNIKELFLFIRSVLNSLPNQPTWRAQMILRGMAYKIQNTLTELIDIEADEYDLISEQEYGRFL